MAVTSRRRRPILIVALAALILSLSSAPTQAQEDLMRRPPGVGQDVCGRTSQVGDAIVTASGAATCADITLRHIREITSLYLSHQGISSLSVGDFDGLVRLKTLDLSGNDLAELPQGVFDELLLLKTLRLDGNQLESLPVRLFDELLMLEELTLNDNPLLSLPDGMFGDFSRFAGLQPDGSRWGSRTLEGFLQEHGVSTVEQFIAALPTDHKQRFAMVYASESPAEGYVSTDYPRITSWGGDGRFTFAWNTDPDAPSEFRDVIEFLRQNDSDWTAGVIDFSGTTPTITQPTSCQTCHGSLNKPLWGAYLRWDGTEYGSGDADPQVIEANLAAPESTDPRIDPLDFYASYFHSWVRYLQVGGYGDTTPVVEEAGSVWAWRHAEVLFRRLKAREDYRQFAEETMCKSGSFDARDHALGPFTLSEHNPAVLSDTGEVTFVQGGTSNSFVVPDYHYNSVGQLGGALVFLMVVDLWEREPIVRKLYREVSNADTILPSAVGGADLLLFYESGSATAEDELIQKLRLHFGAGGQVALAGLGSQTMHSLWSAAFFSGHLDVMAPRVCDALTKTRPTDLRVTPTEDDAVLSWDAPKDVSSLTGYRILRIVDGGTPTVYVADTGTTDTTWTANGLVPGEYVWIVQALFDGYPSPESNAVRKTVAGPKGPGHNTPATGLPTISGIAQVGETLRADISGIADVDGMSGAVFSYQWLANEVNIDTDIAGATDPTYTLVADDVGKAIRVRVSFMDGASNVETLTSEATATVVTPLTAEFRDAPDKHLGTGVFTFVIAFSEPISISYKTLRDDSLDVTNGSATKAKRLDGQSDLWQITVEPDSDADVTVVLPITEDCTAQDAVCTRDGTKLSNRSELTVPGPAAANSPATGAPSISGTAQVGETLTVDTSDIDDADGMSGAVFSYQWLADGVDIAGATGDSYTLVEADVGKAVKVRVVFNDDDYNEETLTSEATAAVAAETAVPDAPQSLNVSPDDTGALDVSWEAPASDGGSAITGYKVQWKSGSEDYDGSAGSTRQAEITDPASRTHTITGLTDGVEYAVRVIAVNDVGDGPPSDEATGTPRETTPPELATATVDGPTLTLTYDEDLDENSEPSSDAFSVAVGGTGRAVDGVSVSGSSVMLTLGSAVASGAMVTVSYAVPTDAAAPRIQDEAGNPAVSFTDQDVENNTPPPANTPATGAPTISGTVRVGETLTAETSAIADADGMSGAVFIYQWLADDADIAGATSDTYTLVDADLDKAVKVRVIFTDNADNEETLTSEATAAVTAAADDSSIWSATLTVGESWGFVGFWKGVCGVLDPDEFSLDGNDYPISMFAELSVRYFQFRLDQALPVAFTLRVGETTFESKDAEQLGGSSSGVYQWTGQLAGLTEGSTVEVSLTLAE